jgi:predicted dehydrogenase
MKRQDFLKLSASMAGFFSLGAGDMVDAAQLEEALFSGESRAKGSAIGLSAAPIATVRTAIIGMGNRGQSLLEMFETMLGSNMASIVALADLQAEKLSRGNEIISAWQKEKPAHYLGAEAWRDLIRRDDIDLVIICTPWELHGQMALAALENGKHVASEVPASYTLEECWQLIETAERTGKHHILLENCCYNDEELWLMNMVEQGVFGDLTHAECAYIHDLRIMLMDESYYENQWRIQHHVHRNGNLYTTHGLGPVSMYFGIGRGDYYSHLVSMSSKEAALSRAVKGKKLPQNYVCGDMNTTLLKTFEGKTVMMQHDTHTGRPYTRINTLCGTNAVHQGYPSRLYIDKGPTWDWHSWTDEGKFAEYRAEYGHHFWKTLGDEARAKSIGHGGMDFIMMWRLIHCLNKGIALDLNVYDGILWSAIGALTELSVAQDSARINVPDFTGGTWKTQRKHEIMRS